MAESSRQRVAAERRSMRAAGWIALRGATRVFLAVLLVSWLAFLLEGLAPGDVDTTRRLEQPWSSPEEEATTPRFGDWLLDALGGDLGRSAGTGVPVLDDVAPRLGETLRLAVSGWLLAWVLALAGGTLEVGFAGRPPAWASQIASGALLAWPPAALALLGAVVATRMGWLRPLFSEDVPLSAGVMPVLVIAACLLPRLTRLVVEEVRSEATRPHCVQELALGLSSRRVLLRCLRARSAVLWTRAGLSFGSAIGLSMIVEIAFSWPGLGPLALEAFGRQDPTLLAGLLALTTACSVGATVLGDLLAVLCDPRLEAGAVGDPA